jgi:hypothetical protein
MPAISATAKAVIEAHYGRFCWVEDCQVRLDDAYFVDVTLYLAEARPVAWMDLLDAASHTVFLKTRYRTIFSCFDASGRKDLLGAA